MSSTKISDLPDFDGSESGLEVVKIPKKTRSIPDVPDLQGSRESYLDILVVFGLLLGATNNELSKSILRFPLLKLQKTDFMFSILLSTIFSVIFVFYKMF